VFYGPLGHGRGWEGLIRKPNGRVCNSEAVMSRSLLIVAWVVLDHSKIYEYGGIDTTQFECQAAIDLRFASVREGRDIDRRFGESPRNQS